MCKILPITIQLQVSKCNLITNCNRNRFQEITNRFPFNRKEYIYNIYTHIYYILSYIYTHVYISEHIYVVIHICTHKCISVCVCRASQVAFVVKNLPDCAGDVRDSGLIPGSGRLLGGEYGNPLQYSCLENPLNRGASLITVHRVT